MVYIGDTVIYKQGNGDPNVSPNTRIHPAIVTMIGEKTVDLFVFFHGLPLPEAIYRVPHGDAMTDGACYWTRQEAGIGT